MGWWFIGSLNMISKALQSLVRNYVTVFVQRKIYRKSIKQLPLIVAMATSKWWAAIKSIVTNLIVICLNQFLFHLLNAPAKKQLD
jgi:hypothetical protein